MLHQADRVGPGPMGCAETGHRQAVDQPAVQAKHVASRDRDQERERGIEAPGDAEVQRRAGRKLFDPFGQPCALNAEYLRATVVQFWPVGWYERCTRLQLRPPMVSASSNKTRR